MASILIKTIGGVKYAFETKHYKSLFDGWVIRGSSRGGVIAYHDKGLDIHLKDLDFDTAIEYMDGYDERLLEELLSNGLPITFLSEKH